MNTVMDKCVSSLVGTIIKKTAKPFCIVVNHFDAVKAENILVSQWGQAVFDSHREWKNKVITGFITKEEAEQVYHSLKNKKCIAFKNWV